MILNISLISSSYIYLFSKQKSHVIFNKEIIEIRFFFFLVYNKLRSVSEITATKNEKTKKKSCNIDPKEQNYFSINQS